MSGLFTAVGGTLENGMSTYVTSVSSALSSALVPVVTTAVSIWIITYGFAVVRGEAHESVPAFAWRGLKVAVILAFALGSGIYQSQVVTVVEGATTGLAQTIQTAAANAGAGNAGCGTVSGSSVTGTSASAIYQTLDCYDQQINLVMDAYFNKATHEGFSIAGIVAGVGDFLCGLVAALGASVFLIILAFEVVMARMLLDLVLGLGPLFIACGAFSPTARFFEAWMAKIANYALLQVLIAAFLGMALTAFSADLAPFQVTTSAPDANASALTAAIQGALDNTASWGAGLGMFVTGVLLATVGWQLPAVASGLAGGATLSGFGAFVAGYAARQALRGLGAAVQFGHGPRRPGGKISDGGTRNGSTPAYQRIAREHLGDLDNRGGSSS
ncbi:MULTISPECIES: type IV secretion system protein [Burkholderiaceae]|jgi:type IV secretion system protein VirB6|uniref:TrbL/VirB6 plasmid conjugal transfer protein n=1 Tax=Paraburkholderia phytofirmans (strain DSM 17436 / LMG 22146 / PsJN) TaxID=398527 RepID=B2T042_PARPJ|nr:MULTISPECIES: type IV secretion system protein [Burkholderiaceae]UTP22288.1 type IV secretion system protein [Burkholderia sp. FXe9]ACD14603.1 TrbL/VirB6 plasmid conjugal transfer protein [Paraburkholderia phytofirmans PsJN]ERJ35421.1 Integral inner membrane protein of type IV secretion complex (VirB6) [Burkholderia sp. AU4i]MBA9947244.1 type IV secretion system protein [Burkholderia cepacia]MBA9977422.1 type IV secretion system protein [Burkholderia cepacia]